MTTQNGQDAVELYRQNMDSIALVLLDMTMPGLNGGGTFDLLRRINPNVKVILTSGYSLEGQAQEILKRGCNGFLKKPFGINELSQILNRTLNRTDNLT